MQDARNVIRGSANDSYIIFWSDPHRVQVHIEKKMRRAMRYASYLIAAEFRFVEKYKMLHLPNLLGH